MSDKKQQSLNIGQVVYVLPDKAEAIVPAIVVEEMVIKKLDGETVSWKVAVGPPEKKKIVASHELSGEVYTSLDEIKDVMTKRLSEFVSNLIKQAENRTEQWYGKQIKQTKNATNASNGESEGQSKKIDATSLVNSIENEDSAFTNEESSQKQQNALSDTYKIKAPVNQGPLQTNSRLDPSNPKGSLREKLRQMADPGEQGSDNDIQSDEYILTPDGRQVPVRYKHNQ